MKQYEQLCINCSARERDVVVSAFCGTRTEQLLKAEQAGPVLNCCRQWIHPRTTDHPTVNTKVPALGQPLPFLTMSALPLSSV